MTHETHRCSVAGCPNLAAYEVMLYDFDTGEGAVRFEPDETCPYLCLEHAVDNEHRAEGARGVHGLLAYPHTNGKRLHGMSIYLDLRPVDIA